jgi:hypothetical protein
VAVWVHLYIQLPTAPGIDNGDHIGSEPFSREPEVEEKAILIRACCKRQTLSETPGVALDRNATELCLLGFGLLQSDRHGSARKFFAREIYH